MTHGKKHKLMTNKCTKCGKELAPGQPRTVRFALPRFSNWLKTTTPYICQDCDEEPKSWAEQYTLINTGIPWPSDFKEDATGPDDFKKELATISVRGPSSCTSVSYQAACHANENVLFPITEGNIQDGTVIDRYGDPDLMIEFSNEYLGQYEKIMPRKPPRRLSEMMPPLLLLIVATELAIKAYLMRSGTTVPSEHDLARIYKLIDPQHVKRIEQSFTGSEIVQALLQRGGSTPKIEHILTIYSQSYGGKHGVYMDARYYAEPTTKLPRGGAICKVLISSKAQRPIRFFSLS